MSSAPISADTAGADAPFVLFDPVDAPARLYRTPRAHCVADADAALLHDWLAAELGAGREVALFLGFEAAQELAQLPLARPAAGSPRVEALSFDAAELLAEPEVEAWLGAACCNPPGPVHSGVDSSPMALTMGSSPPPNCPRPRQISRRCPLPPRLLGADPEPAGFAGWRRGIGRAAYGEALRRIGDYIAAGDCYQVDYTFALHARAFGSPLALYRALRQRQPTPYRCLARLRGRWVLSLSPELFFELGGAPGAAMLPGRIAVRPMKGTAPRGADAAADAQAAARLRADPKNRAENLMILDLLRNDLGRLARPGSVQVPQRFAVEPHPAVWQMTSSAQAELAPGTTWPTLWRALFPCGSVVGAPKHRAMQIIGELETGARGLYTGAIGWIAPQGGAAPEQAQARFSVAIRTLEIDARPRRGLRAARLGLGSGIVADSNADAEWAECLLKGRFATALDPGFGLIETFAARWPGQRAAVDAHLRRLARSARWFGFRFDRRGLVAALARAQAAWDPAQALRSRIELRHDGSFEVTAAPLAPLRPGRVELLLARDVLDDAVLDAADALLRHKTTRRACFDAAWRAAEARGAFDALFFNQRGELCEGGRSSVFVKLDGRWFTPPLRCGLLPGVTRAALLAEASLGATERVLDAADLQRAEDLLVCNALRGALPARLRGAGSACG